MSRALFSVGVFPVRWPLRRAFVTALGRKTHSDNVLVKAVLSGGAEGWGEASSSLAMAWQTGPKMAAALRRLAARFRGRDVREMEKIAGEAWRSEPGMPTAVAAFETALWDALARAEGIPFYKLWGGRGKKILTLMSVSAVPPEEVAARVREGSREGFRIFKLKLNGREPEVLNLARIRAAHRAAPRARLLLDPNQSHAPAALSSLLGSIRRDGLPVDLVEEPFPKHDWKSLAAFRGKSSAPLLLDESIQTAADARRVVKNRLAQGVNVKLAKSGLLKTRDILKAFPASRSRVLMIGCMAESKIGLSAAAQFAMGTGTFDYADLDSDLLLKPMDVPGGYLRRGPWLSLPKDPPPGLGVSWSPS